MDYLRLFLEMDVSLQAVVSRKEEVITLAASRLSENSGIDSKHIKSVLQARESLGSTALGHGVAMPHAVSQRCLYPACTLIGLSLPVKFDSLDGQGVDVVLASIWPQNDTQRFLGFLSIVSRLMRDPAMLKPVRTSDAQAAIRNSFYYGALAVTRRRADKILSFGTQTSGFHAPKNASLSGPTMMWDLKSQMRK